MLASPVDIHSRIDERSNRIGIDTGAYQFGVLTVLGMEGGDRWFIQQDEAALEPEPARPE